MTELVPKSAPRAVIDDRYEVISSLGQGGMGDVFLVHDRVDGERCALKRLRPRRGSRERQLLRFRREFSTMAQLDHPGIVRVFDYGLDRGTPYFTMELLEGGDLHEHALRPLVETCASLRDVAAALSFLHARRLLHRDLSLRNVRLSDDHRRAKLIDFGVMSTIGVSGEVVGTPPFVAPEMVMGLPLDHRADLYALGALAYRILVGRHAYAARDFDELRSAWRDRPAPPSTYRPEVPPALDDLVMRLLSAEPLARPTSAAEVIDRLGAIVDLPPQPEQDLARGWLQSNALVGREEELDRARRALLRLSGREPRGGALLVEGEGGMGKSRMMQEIGLEAQLRGAVVVNARAGERQGAYALLRDVTQALLARCRADVEAAAAPHLSVLVRVLPALAEGRDVAVAAILGDPAEDRIRLQREAVAFMRALCRRRSIVIVVDDAQRADEGSAALFASLAHAASEMALLIVAAMRSDESPRAPAALAAMRDAGARLRLRALSLEQVEALVRSTFGAGPDVAVIARFIHRHADRPLHSVELMRKLVDEGVLSYRDGLWTVSGDLEAVEVPRGLAEALRVRLELLPERSRRLAEALSVHPGELSLELCARLSEDDEVLFADLAVLVGEGVLVGSGDGYRFRHDGLREALLGGLEAERRAALHRQAAAVLEALDEGKERELEIGWHHHAGGDLERAAPFLERGGRRLYEAHGFRDAVAPLEAALAIMEQHGEGRRRCLELRQMLMRAGVICDRDVILRYADETIAAMRRDSGMALASRLLPWVGSWLAVALGLAWAALRHPFRSRAQRGFSPVHALTALLALVNYTASVRSLSFQIAELEELVDILRPLRGFLRFIPGGAYLFARTFLAIPTGQLDEVAENVKAILESFERDQLTPLADIDRRIARGGAHYMIASCRALDQDPRFADELEALGQVGLRFFDLGAQMDRLFFHRLRGEEDQAGELLAATEISYVQLGNAWVFESQLAWISSFAYAFCRDVIGLKRSIGHLDRLVESGYRMASFAHLARGEYLRERGDAAGATAALFRALGELRDDESYGRQMVFAALSETHLAAGALSDARKAAEEGLAIGAAGRGLCTAHLRCGRALALVEASTGEHDSAAKRLEGLLSEAAVLASPSIVGGLHEARARVAFAAGDRAGFLHHRVQASSWLRRSNNPALVARSERLDQLDQTAVPREPGIVSHEAVTVVERTDARSRVSRTLAGCRGREERLARALEILVDESEGAHGFLFVPGPEGGARLAAPHGGDEPPRALIRAAERRLVARPATETGVITVPAEAARYAFVELCLGPDERVIAVAAIAPGPLPLRPIEEGLSRAIAGHLRDAGDVLTATSG